MTNAVFTRTFNPQTGMVLLLCLIFLTALTLLGLSATADTVLQNKLSANLQETERAKQSALATLSWAELWLLGLKDPAPETCTTSCKGLYLHSPGDLPPHPESESFNWWMARGHEAGINPVTGARMRTVTGSNSHPSVWIIEAIHSIPPEDNPTGHLRVWYRILARGSGHTEAAISVVESTVVRSWASVGLSVADDPEICTDSSEECGRISWRELR